MFRRKEPLGLKFIIQMLCEKLVLFIILDQQVSFNYDFDLNYLQKSIFFDTKILAEWIRIPNTVCDPSLENYKKQTIENAS